MRKRRWISHLAFILRNKVQGKRSKELGNFGLVSTPLPYALGRAPCAMLLPESEFRLPALSLPALSLSNGSKG